MMKRIEVKCLICNQKYYSPEQDDRHTHGRPPNAKITEAGGGTIAESHPPSNIQLDSEKKAQTLSTSQAAGDIDEASGKKIKKFDVPSFIVNKPIPQSVEPTPKISTKAEAKKEAVLAKKRATSREYQRKKRAAA